MKADRNPSKIKKILLQGLVLAGVFVVVTQWQSRSMLKENIPAPGLTLTTIDGTPFSPDEYKGTKTVLYFFAPWCSVCRFTSGTMEKLRKDTVGGNVSIIAIALSWKSIEEVKNFTKNHELTMPVLMGDEKTAQDYKVEVFPSIYLLDENGRIKSRLAGYTSFWGLKIRLLLM